MGPGWAGRVAGGVRPNRSTPSVTVARTPCGRSSDEVPCSLSAATSLGPPGDAGSRPPTASSASRWTTSRCSAGASSRSRSSSISARPPSAVVDDLVEHVGLVAQDLGERQHVVLRGRVDALERRHQVAADPVARVGRRLV